MEVVRLARPGLMSLVHSWKSLWSPRLSPGHCPLYCKEGATSLGGVGSGLLQPHFRVLFSLLLDLVVVWEIKVYIYRMRDTH